jgi:hypothetical protein
MPQQSPRHAAALAMPQRYLALHNPAGRGDLGRGGHEEEVSLK